MRELTSVTMTPEEYQKLKADAAAAYQRGYDDAMRRATEDACEILTHNRQLRASVEILTALREGDYARANEAADIKPAKRKGTTNEHG